MKSILNMAVALTGVLLLGACATAPRHTTGKTASTEKTPYDFRSEGRIPPPSPTQAPVEPDVEEIPLPDSALDVTNAAPPPDTVRTPPAPADSTAAGFRIQVFASSDRTVAESAAAAAEQRLGIKAYVDLDAGMYKVRVGDFVDRKAAEAVLPTLRGHYYQDAWIVPATVRVPRKP